MGCLKSGKNNEKERGQQLHGACHTQLFSVFTFFPAARVAL
jgi:hypothetical protein